MALLVNINHFKCLKIDKHASLFQTGLGDVKAKALTSRHLVNPKSEKKSRSRAWTGDGLAMLEELVTLGEFDNPD